MKNLTDTLIETCKSLDELHHDLCAINNNIAHKYILLQHMKLHIDEKHKEIEQLHEQRKEKNTEIYDTLKLIHPDFNPNTGDDNE